MPIEKNKNQRSLFNRISEPEIVLNKNGHKIRWAWYQCECLESQAKFRACRSVEKGHVKSCGCLGKKHARELGRKNKTHGLYHHPLYQLWARMKIRAKKESIYVQKDWKKFIPFYNWAIKSWSVGLCVTRQKEKTGFVSKNCHFSKKGEKDALWTLKKKDDTCIRLYGTTIPTRNKQIQEKTRKTCKEKYGVHTIALVPEVRAKRNATCEKLYGTAFPTPTFKQENTVRGWLESFGELWPSNSSILGSKQIDCYCINKKIGLEYSGIIWHSDFFKKNKDKLDHYNKYRNCLDNNIRLFNIFSDEWVNRNHQIQNHIKRELGYSSRKVNAASCQLKELSKETAFAFYNTNGLRPISDPSRIYKSLGIFKRDELLCCLIYVQYGEKIRLLRPAYLDNIIIRNFKSLVKNIVVDGPIFAKTDNRLDSNWPERDFGFNFLEDEKPKFRYVRSSKEQRYIEKPEHKTIGKIYNAGRKIWIYNGN